MTLCHLATWQRQTGGVSGTSQRTTQKDPVHNGIGTGQHHTLSLRLGEEKRLSIFYQSL